jgi:hypothetical protein
MREICTSGSVGGEGGNVLAYPALRSLCGSGIINGTTEFMAQ